MPCIALEGVDGAGKTTLIKELVKRHPRVRVVHHGPPEVDRPLLMQYSEEVERYKPGSGELLVFDRLALGERVYGPILRGECRLTEQQYSWFQGLLLSRGVLTVVLSPPLFLVQERFAERGDSLISAVDLARIHAHYLELCSTPLVDYVAKMPPDPDLVLKLAEVYEESVLPLVRFRHYSGPPAPDVLFVGDTPGTRGPKPAHPTPFTPYKGICGDTLYRALDGAFQSFNYGIMNSERLDVAGLWNALFRPRVVALGNLAAQRLSRLGIEHEKVAHPQYVRRFRSAPAQQLLYSIELEEAATGKRSWRRERIKQEGDC